MMIFLLFLGLFFLYLKGTGGGSVPVSARHCTVSMYRLAVKNYAALLDR